MGGIEHIIKQSGQGGSTNPITSRTSNYEIFQGVYLPAIDLVLESGGTTISRFQSLRPTNVYIPDGVTTINDESFFSTQSIRKLRLPNSLTTVGYRAFNSAFDSNILYAYPNYSIDVVIPSSVTNFGVDCFAGLRANSVTFENGITEIAGFNLGAITNITLPSTLITIKANCFVSSYQTTTYINDLPPTVTTIENNAFDNARYFTIQNWDFSNVVTIGDYAFRGNVYLRHGLTINALPVLDLSGCTSIGIGAFRDCINLKKVIIPDTITNIPNYAFFGTKITSVELKTGTTLGTNAFPASCNITYRP